MMKIDAVVAKTNAETRPYQLRIIQKVSDMFGGRFKNQQGVTELPARSVMIESPTGSGKTVMALLSCKAFQHENPDVVIGWIAMRRNLLAQAARENVRHGINVENIHFISMFDKSPDVLLKAKKDGRKVMLVVDEAQHDAASSMAHLHNIIEPENILGMTATPFRTDKMKLCFDKVIKDAGIHQLIQDGYLSKFDHFSIPKWDAQTVADHYCLDPERWGKSIFYFVNLAECNKLHRIFMERGIRSEVVDGNSDWEDQLDKFKTGEVPCLINCMKLTEGFDEPSLKTAWVRDSGKGPTMQMGGRAFRKHNDLPVKNIVQSKNTHWPMIRTAMPRIQYIWQNDQWMSLQVNPLINLINHNARIAIATMEVEMPDFITKNASKRRAPRMQ